MCALTKNGVIDPEDRALYGRWLDFLDLDDEEYALLVEAGYDGETPVFGTNFVPLVDRGYIISHIEAVQKIIAAREIPEE